MDPLRPIKAFDRWQQRHASAAVPVAVVKKFGDDQGGNLSALIAYYGFFSLFPLLLVMTTVLGWVLQGNPHARDAIIHSAISDIPIIGHQAHAGALHGSVTAFVIGLVGALLSGLGVTLALQTAFDRVNAIPHRERPDVLFSRLRGLRLLAVVGTLQIVSTTAAGIVTGGLGGVLASVGGVCLSLALNVLLFTVAFRMLTPSAVATRALRPGIAAASVLWTTVQVLGGAYINHVVRGAGAAYGTFATVIGLLTWLFLGARIVVYSAELNVVLADRLWPRGIFDVQRSTDRQVLRGLAQIEERVEGQRVDVVFDAPPEKK